MFHFSVENIFRSIVSGNASSQLSWKPREVSLYSSFAFDRCFVRNFL